MGVGGVCAVFKGRKEKESDWSVESRMDSPRQN